VSDVTSRPRAGLIEIAEAEEQVQRRLRDREARLAAFSVVYGTACLQLLRAHGKTEEASQFTQALDALNRIFADGVGDDEYLERLERNLAGILAAFPADLVFYLAGVDIVQGDRYGRLALSDAGLRRRERHVLESCRRAGLPVAITIAGGYATTPGRTAELHAIVFEEARARFG
jgi:acetoin utilization deacetylase AcuC-like enzyme